ncbi:hypothetical protein J4477_00160 [Candidatus Pacearchaeota archaeon]|nr:hypothetical protein [Candidatus Pacearchaeota archaeon]
MTSYLSNLYGLHDRIFYHEQGRENSAPSEQTGIEKKIAEANEIEQTPAQLGGSHYCPKDNSNEVFRKAFANMGYGDQLPETD